jgi:hypothetical protein
MNKFNKNKLKNNKNDDILNNIYNKLNLLSLEIKDIKNSIKNKNNKVNEIVNTQNNDNIIELVFDEKNISEMILGMGQENFLKKKSFDPLSILLEMSKNIESEKINQKVIEEVIDDYCEIDENIKIENLNIEIKTIDDLIKLGYLYKELYENLTEKIKLKKEIIKKKKIKQYKELYELNGKYYLINLEILYNLIGPLIKLKDMIGLTNIKDSIIDMILYYLQNLEKNNNNMLHTVIEGAPGVGKTELAKILGEIYAGMGIIENKFKIVKRTDLIGEYLGHTAQKTKKILDEVAGGVLFIDEAYSLGSKDGKDSFSKECIDTLNLYLSENKNKMICIIAGYKDELESCFFSQNPGLSRRFPFRYTIEGYNYIELSNIFIKKIVDINWKLHEELDKDYLKLFFKNNMNNFKNYGGDIDNLIVQCKFCHSRRMFTKHPSLKKIFNIDDLKKGFKKFTSSKNEKNDLPSYIYI